MITPRFSCSQTENSVVVSVYCPSIRAADVEINVDETLLTVHMNPYFLRLNFPHNLVEDDSSSANYDPGTGYLTMTLTKEQKGQHFGDLDLLAKLLAPRASKTSPSIEVLSSAGNDDLSTKLANINLDASANAAVFQEAAQNDWQLPQQLPGSLPELHKTIEKPYGFLDMHSGYLRHVGHTENEINELGENAESCPKDERMRLRIEHEEAKWDAEHYTADFADDEYIQELLHWKHPYTTTEEPFEYTESENLEILRLPRKEYLATARQTHELYLTLVSLLHSYTYESRTNQLDPTPESAWTICTLTPAFSALDPPTAASDWTPPPSGDSFSKSELVGTLVPSYRRCLAFPLYRSFSLSEQCRLDTAELLLKGKRTVMRCLLDMKRILDHHEVYYIYTKIWVDDFCVWIQTYARDDVLLQLGQSLKEVSINKDAIGWPLQRLEASTRYEDSDRGGDSDDESISSSD